MGTVKIIGQNSGLTIRMDCRQWQDQAVELEAKLRLLKTRDGHPAEVFFDSDPGAERLKQLFEILQATGCVCRGRKKLCLRSAGSGETERSCRL